MHERPHAKAFVSDQPTGRSAVLQGISQEPFSMPILSRQPDALQEAAAKSLAIVAGRQWRAGSGGQKSRVCRSWVANREKHCPQGSNRPYCTVTGNVGRWRLLGGANWDGP